MNGIGTTLDRWKPKQVLHLLVHTDTAVGRAAATVVQEGLEQRGHQVQPLTAVGLRTDDLASFRDALADLTRQIERDWAVPYRERGWSVVFNLTGGFKSLNAYLQALGMLYADRSVFVFESAPVLMEIPRLPVRLAEADEVRAHLGVFRRLARGYAVSEQDARDVPDSLLLSDEGQVTTSVWGDVVWNRVCRSLLAETFYEPWSKRVQVKDSVRKAFPDLDSDQRIQVNEALDEFCAFMDGIREELPKSRTFKKLAGNPVPGSTHELYA